MTGGYHRAMRITPEQLYEEDFYAWTRHQAAALRRWRSSRPNVDLDLAHIAEEIADLGKEQRNALRSWTARIIEHLLLLEHSPASEQHRHGAREVSGFRTEIDARLTPTLRADLARRLPTLFDQSRRRLAAQLERFDEADVAARLPPECPYTLEQIIGDWWPG